MMDDSDRVIPSQLVCPDTHEKAQSKSNLLSQRFHDPDQQFAAVNGIPADVHELYETVALAEAIQANAGPGEQRRADKPLVFDFQPGKKKTSVDFQDRRLVNGIYPQTDAGAMVLRKAKANNWCDAGWHTQIDCPGRPPPQTRKKTKKSAQGLCKTKRKS
jgi:hypothetical protein